jgi:type II secretory pathway component GspD/PulD (secretin)
VWYYDGHALYVYHELENQTELVTLEYIDAQKVENALRQLHVWDNRFGWQSKPEQKRIVVSGPPRYTYLVKWVITKLDEVIACPPDPDGKQWRTFQLSHARVYDRVIEFQKKKVVVPGAITQFKNLLNGHPDNAVLDEGDQKPKSKNTTHEQVHCASELPYVERDTITNSIIVYGTRDCMAYYENIIDQLDTRTE